MYSLERTRRSNYSALRTSNKFTTYRKLKDRWKDIRTLEYTDSTGTKVKLSDDDINEFMAMVPFKNHLQNEF